MSLSPEINAAVAAILTEGEGMPSNEDLETRPTGEVRYWDASVYYDYRPNEIPARPGPALPTQARLEGRHLSRSWQLNGASVRMTDNNGDITRERISTDVARTYTALARLTRMIAWMQHNRQAD